MPSAVVVGGGPSGLMAAEVLATTGFEVTVYDAMASVGRKLLLAGRGGLNLTHSEPIERFVTRYGTAQPVIESAIRAFGPDDLRSWCASLGVETFVGTSGRVFPTSLRATPLLRAWLRRLDELGVAVALRHRWSGWDELGRPTFLNASGAVVSQRADVTVLALGGGSWPRTGSDGAWLGVLDQAGIATTPLRPANSGFRVAWSESFRKRFAGVPVKNLRLSVGAVQSRGEAMITGTGIEGGAVYSVASALRDLIERHGPQPVAIDLHPDVDEPQLAERLARRRPGESTSTLLRRIGLPPVAVGLLREATGNQLPMSSQGLSALIKHAPVTVLGPEAIGRAISSAGGVRLDQVDEAFMLHARPGVYVVGEMLDWEAPTGGYLLQACFSTAVVAARGALDWLGG